MREIRIYFIETHPDLYYSSFVELQIRGQYGIKYLSSLEKKLISESIKDYFIQKSVAIQQSDLLIFKAKNQVLKLKKSITDIIHN